MRARARCPRACSSPKWRLSALEQIELAALLLVADGLGRREIEDRRAFAAEQRALVAAGRKPELQFLRTAERLRPASVQDDERGQVLDSRSPGRR